MTEIHSTADPAAGKEILPLELADVGYRIGTRQLIDSATVTLSAGPRTVVLGPNGAGKSIFLRLCHGLLTPTSGSVTWRGGASRPAHHQAMVFQRPVMLRRSAAANLDYALGIRGYSRARRKELIRRALERTGLGGLADSPARQLSVGEQQRLALARAWTLTPEVLFLDEPTANLDPASASAVEDIINAIHQAGAKIVMTTHDLAQARRLADDVLFLHHGRILERGPAEHFFETPQSSEAAAFLRGELAW